MTENKSLRRRFQRTTVNKSRIAGKSTAASMSAGNSIVIGTGRIGIFEKGGIQFARKNSRIPLHCFFLGALHRCINKSSRNL